MTRDTGRFVLYLVVACSIVIMPAAAVLNTISTGGTVFIGEQGLDVSAPVPVANTQIAWWGPGYSVLTQEPNDRINVTDPTNFVVSPITFGSKMGSWYILPGKTSAFTVADPQINIRIEDTTINGDITDNQWVYRGDEVRFRIDTNLAVIASRTGVGATEPTITIKVQGPDGGIYSALMDNNGGVNSLDFRVTTSPFYTNSIWNTGSSTYVPGTYTIWAECNANRMKDNYNVEGKTVSVKRILKVQEQNPLINAGTPTTSQTTQVTTSATTAVPTKPKTTPVTTTATTQVTQVTLQETPVQPTTTITTPLPAVTTKRAPGFTAGLLALAVLGAGLYRRKFP